MSDKYCPTLCHEEELARLQKETSEALADLTDLTDLVAFCIVIPCALLGKLPHQVPLRKPSQVLDEVQKMKLQLEKKNKEIAEAKALPISDHVVN